MKYLIHTPNILIKLICVTCCIVIFNTGKLRGQNCPNMSTVCADAPLMCGINQLDGHSCSLVSYPNYSGERCVSGTCFASADNTAHYAFTTNGTSFSVNLNYNNCQPGSGDIGLQMEINSSCCSGNVYCTQGGWTNGGITTVYINGKLDPCKVYYLNIDGLSASYCDYTLSIQGGGANVPLVLKDINDEPTKIIKIGLGSCITKFTVDPRDAACNGYMEWTLDGVPINDHDNEIQKNFPMEGDFQLCVMGYIGLPNFNCGQSNMTCSKIEVRKEHRFANTRYLCNELKGYKWFKQTIYNSGIYTQEFQDKCNIVDSTIEFVLLPKPQDGIVNYISCSRLDPYYDPVLKDYYRSCTNNKKIYVPKSTEEFGCDSSYILTVAYIDYKNTMHLMCAGGNLYMVPELTNYSDTCGISLDFKLNYNWHEKTNTDLIFLSNSRELKITKKGDYQLQLFVNYQKGTIGGSCIILFEEDIDEDTYLVKPSTGFLNGKVDVCKGDIECYAVKDIVENPFNFNWSIQEGIILTPNPSMSDSICVQWDKNSTMTHGKICATYSDSCSSNLQACLDIEFGKSQKDVAGPNQKVQGVLGTKLNAQGKKGLWTYAGGPGTVHFTDPTDPKTKVKVSRFGSYMFKWTTIEGDCEIYGFVTVNFFIEFAELEGEYFKHFYNLGEKGSDFKNIQSRYDNDQLNVQGELTNPSRIQFQIVNIQGQILYSDEMQISESTFVKNIDLELSSGIYYLVLTNNSEYKINKFTVFNDH